VFRVGGSNGVFPVRQYPRWWLTAILEQPPSWNDGAVARNPCVSWAFLFFAVNKCVYSRDDGNTVISTAGGCGITELSVAVNISQKSQNMH